MKRVEPQQYLERIEQKFDIINIYKLDEDLINEQSRELDRRIEIAKLFVPKIEKAGPYDIRYDLAATMVLMLAPFDQRTTILKYICNHYKIYNFYPYNIMSSKDFYESNGIYYHPGYPAYLYAHPSFPSTRFKDFNELLTAIRASGDQILDIDLFLRILYYYGWRSTEFKIAPMEIDIINSILPYYPHTIEEVNYTLENIYNQGLTIIKRPKFIKDLVEKLERDYKTIKKYLETLTLQKRLRIALWIDIHYLNLESIALLIPGNFNIRIKTSYTHHVFRLRSPEKKETYIGITTPKDLVGSFVKYLEQSTNIPFKVYKVYNIPLIHYNFGFYSNEKNVMLINWEEVDEFFKKSVLKSNPDHLETEYVPVRAKKGDIDTMMLKIHEYLASNVNVSNSLLMQACDTTAQNISMRRKILENVGLRFPYIFDLNCPENYFLKINTSKINVINYIIHLLSIFPYVYYTWFENLNLPTDKFLLAWIYLPIESYDFLRELYSRKLPINNELYYVFNRTYLPALHFWEIYDEQKKDYNFDFGNFQFEIIPDM